MHIHVQIVNAVDFLLSVIDDWCVRALHTDMPVRMYPTYKYMQSTVHRLRHLMCEMMLLAEYMCKKYLAASHFPRLR